MSNKILIVLSGEAGAGKDSVAKILVKNHNFVLHSLAAPLKRFAEDMFGFTEEQLYGPSKFRNAPDSRWARPCDGCSPGGLWSENPKRMHFWGDVPQDGYKSEDCQICFGSKVINDNSPRRVLQLLGEEYLRQMIHPDALTIRARSEIEALLNSGVNVVVNDARNENDRVNLHEWLGGVRVDVRTPVSKDDGAAWRQHSSELSRPTDEQVEYVLMNDEEFPFSSLSQKVTSIIAKIGVENERR